MLGHLNGCSTTKKMSLLCNIDAVGHVRLKQIKAVTPVKINHTEKKIDFINWEPTELIIPNEKEKNARKEIIIATLLAIEIPLEVALLIVAFDEPDYDEINRKRGFNQFDIELVMSTVPIPRKGAVEALLKHNGDVVNAVMSFV